GCRLFDRTNRGLNLNAQGELYYQRILPLIQGLQQSTEIIRKQNTKRSIRIRAHSTFCVYWLIPRLADFYNKYRDINVELLTVSGMFPVTHDDVDATIRLGNGTWPGVSSLALTRNVVAPACSPEIAKSLRKPDDLAGHTLLHSKARKHDWRSWLQAVQCTEV